MARTPGARRGGVIAKNVKGPPPKITLDRLRNFVAHVSQGLDLATAARAVGVHPNTVYTWNRRGRTELVRIEDEWDIDPLEMIPTLDEGWPREGVVRITTDEGTEEREFNHWTQPPTTLPNGEQADVFDPIEWAFVVFTVAVEKAQAAWESRTLKAIQDASVGADGRQVSWQAAAWLLERRNPQRYGRPEARLRLVDERQHSDDHVRDAVVISADDLEARFMEIESLMPDIVDAEVVDDEPA